MRKKIFLFSRDPGGANTVIPLVKPLKEKGYIVRLFGKDAALEKYLKADLSGFNIANFVKNIDIEYIKKFLINEQPDFIITDTSLDFIERYLWKAAEDLKIPSFAILDQWVNYGIRFSKYNPSETNEYNKDKTYPYLPSKILVMDDFAKQEAIKEGLPPDRITVAGQPHFETLLKKKLSLQKSRNLREELCINQSDFLITFASEPVSKDYQQSGDSGHYWGFTEKTIFKELFNGINEISFKYNKNISIIIKLHPREDIDNYSNMVSPLKRNKITLNVIKKTNPTDLILSSDLICGMSSIFLIESIVLGKPTISIQIGLNKENPFILDRRDILKSIVDQKTLIKQLESIIIKNNYPSYKFDFIKNPVNNILLQMEKFRCQG
tara:strand:+ start:6478 stop:7617 length:1140 start_codon:yes stop_codon:yes gene_type:complete